MICQLYYPHWEKKRILWLYNNQLRKRLRFIQTAKNKIINEKLIQSRTNELQGWQKLKKVLSDSNLMNSIILSQLKHIGYFFYKRTCALCIQKNRNYHICQACETVYCLDCWYDINEICIACDVKCILSNQESEDHFSMWELN